MPELRSPEAVRSDIAVEREQLAAAVGELRRRLGAATDVKSRVGSRVGVLAPAAFAAGFVASGGLGATMRYLARRGRDRR